MIWLTNQEILRAVRHSLLDHVLPGVSEEYARVQVHAAAVALEEVVTRLASGDPVAEENLRIAALLQGAGVNTPAERGQASEEQRAYNAAARTAFSDALAAADDHGTDELLAGWAAIERETAKADARWISGEALASLE